MNTQRKIGLFLVVLPPCGAPLVYIIGYVWLRALSASDPVPNQGAMMLAYVSTIASMILAALLMLTGMCLVLTSYTRLSSSTPDA